MKILESLVWVIGVVICVTLPWICIIAGISTCINNFSFWGVVSGVSMSSLGVLINYIVKPISIIRKSLGDGKSYKWF